MTKFIDTATAGKPRRTADGYLVADVRAARSGIQLYAGHELGRPDLSVVRVFRPEEEVFHKDSLASYAHKPAVNGHPPENVNAENWKDYATGQIGGDVVRDGDHVRVPLILMDGKSIEDYEKGLRTELSMGYSAKIEFGDGITPSGEQYDAVQRDIRINHISQEERGRAGTARIGDSASTWGASPINDFQPGDKPKTVSKTGGHVMSDALKTVVLGDKAVQVAVTDVAAIEQFKTDSAKALADAESKHTTAIAAKDEEIGKLKADLKVAQDAANIDVDALVTARTDLVAQVKAIDAKIDPKGKSDGELKKAAVAAKLGDAMVADASDAEINGMFKAIASEKPGNPVADAIRHGIQPIGDAAQQMNDAFNKGVADMNAWRQEA